MKMKAQSSTEFMVGVAMLVFLVLTAQIFVFERASLSWQVRTHSACIDTANSVANGLSIAGYSDGGSILFTVPHTLSETGYSLTVHSGFVALDYSGDSCMRRFTAQSVKYYGSAPPFNLTGGTYRVNNSLGVLNVEKVE